MKLLTDFFPIILFFIIYKLYGIYTATIAAIIATIIQISLTFLKTKKLDKMQLVTLAMITIFGGATLFLHNEMFIKWKPTAVNWLFALAFFISPIFTKQPLIKRMLQSAVSLPAKVWVKLNLAWGLFFTLMGFANLYVVYHFSTDAWVNFKLFGNLGLTILFVIIQSLFLAKHMQEE